MSSAPNSRDVRGERVDIVLRTHVELEGFLGLQAVELVLDDIGRDDGSAFGDKSFRNRAADALAGGSHQRDFILHSAAHALPPALIRLYSTP